MSEQEATLDGTFSPDKKTAKPNKGGRPKGSKSRTELQKALDKRKTVKPTPEQYEQGLEAAIAGGQLFSPEKRKLPWLGQYRKVQILRAPDMPQYQPFCLGDLPQMWYRRGVDLIMPIEHFNILKDTFVPRYKCDIETNTDPYNINYWEEPDSFHKYQDMGEATEEEFVAFIQGERKKQNPFRRNK